MTTKKSSKSESALPANIKQYKDVLNKKFQRLYDKTNTPPEPFYISGSGLFGSPALILKTDNSKTVITETATTFKIKHEYYGDLPKKISKDFKKKTLASDTNTIASFVNKYVKPKKY